MFWWKGSFNTYKDIILAEESFWNKLTVSSLPESFQEALRINFLYRKPPGSPGSEKRKFQPYRLLFFIKMLKSLVRNSLYQMLVSIHTIFDVIVDFGCLSVFSTLPASTTAHFDRDRIWQLFFFCLNFSCNFFLLQFQLLSSLTRLISYEEKCDKTELPQFWTSKMCDKTKMMNTRHMSDVSVYRSWLILSLYFILPNKYLITLILIICNFFSKCPQLHTMTYRP